MAGDWIADGSAVCCGPPDPAATLAASQENPGVGNATLHSSKPRPVLSVLQHRKHQLLRAARTRRQLVAGPHQSCGPGDHRVYQMNPRVLPSDAFARTCGLYQTGFPSPSNASKASARGLILLQPSRPERTRPEPTDNRPSSSDAPRSFLNASPFARTSPSSLLLEGWNRSGAPISSNRRSSLASPALLFQLVSSSSGSLRPPEPAAGSRLLPCVEGWAARQAARSINSRGGLSDMHGFARFGCGVCYSRYL